MDLCGFVENAKTTQDFMVYPKFYSDATTTKKKKKKSLQSLYGQRQQNIGQAIADISFVYSYLEGTLHP
jgi:hypothetical protein